MGTGYVRQSASDITTGNTIEATPLNDEFDAIAAFASGSTGHSHDGTAGEGPQIDLALAVTGSLPVANGGSGAATFTDGGILLGSGTGAFTVTAQPTDGQLLIGSTGVDPVLATLTGGEGIDIAEGSGTITISGEDATDSNKGIANFGTDDFTVASGTVSLADDVVKDVSTDSGAVTPATHTITIAGGTGIDTSGAGSTVTLAVDSTVIQTGDDPQFGGTVTVGQDIVHLGDTDTKMRFTNDKIEFQAGGVTFLELTEDTEDDATFNVPVYAFPKVIEDTGATNTLALTDANTVQRMNRATAQDVTIPTNAAVAFAVDQTQIAFLQQGVGAVTITGDTGVTVNGTSAGSVTINAQYKSCLIIKIATDEWIVVGDAS